MTDQYAKISTPIKMPILIVSRANKALIGKPEVDNILSKMSSIPFSNFQKQNLPLDIKQESFRFGQHQYMNLKFSNTASSSDQVAYIFKNDPNLKLPTPPSYEITSISKALDYFENKMPNKLEIPIGVQTSATQDHIPDPIFKID